MIVFRRAIRYTPRPINDRRLRDAERRLRLQREALPLFAAEIAASQPTAAERIELCEAGAADFWLNMRNLWARFWREGRRMLRAADPALAAEIIDRWNRGPLPKDAGYFVGFVRAGLRNLEDTGVVMCADQATKLANTAKA